ncbi:MAG: hypothetical protein V4724_30665 [Pseudomonadota bacterium]
MWRKWMHAVVMVGVFATGTGSAAEWGTEQEAVTMVRKVTALIRAEGKDKVIAEVNSGSGRFRDRDLYVSITDLHAALVK